MEEYKNYRILVRVDDVIPPLSGGQAYCGKLDRLYNFKIEQDEQPQLHIHHAKTRVEAEKLAMYEAKEWIDAQQSQTDG